MPKLIYIADDEENICELVKMFLQSEGYQVETFPNGDLLLERFLKNSCDLVILDIMMPGNDGFVICNRIRAISSVPIILLTAKDSDTDYIAGITLGSDDYLTKPFSPTILNMRVKALLRRVEMSQSKDFEELTCGDLTFSPKKHSISCNTYELELTKIEFTCLTYLMKHFGDAVSRKELLNEVWGYESDVETRVTDETIRRIRRKLTHVESSVEIANIWGYGYTLRGDKP